MSEQERDEFPEVVLTPAEPGHSPVSWLDETGYLALTHEIERAVTSERFHADVTEAVREDALLYATMMVSPGEWERGGWKLVEVKLKNLAKGLGRALHPALFERYPDRRFRLVKSYAADDWLVFEVRWA